MAASCHAAQQQPCSCGGRRMLRWRKSPCSCSARALQGVYNTTLRVSAWGFIALVWTCRQCTPTWHSACIVGSCLKAAWGGVFGLVVMCMEATAAVVTGVVLLAPASTSGVTQPVMPPDRGSACSVVVMSAAGPVVTCRVTGGAVHGQLGMHERQSKLRSSQLPETQSDSRCLTAGQLSVHYCQPRALACVQDAHHASS